MIEGIEDAFLTEDQGVRINQLNMSIMAGDSARAASLRKTINDVYAVLDIPRDYRLGIISIDSIHIRLMDNFVYDIINMGSFNFVNGSFDNLYFRFPTIEEYDAAFDMVENNISGEMLGLAGTNKGDCLSILTSSREFYEGLIIWAYKSLVVRDPLAEEVARHMTYLQESKNFQELQIQIMITDEYANF